VRLGAPSIVRGNNRPLCAAACCRLDTGRFIFKTWTGHGYQSRRGLILTLQDLARVQDLAPDPQPGSGRFSILARLPSTAHSPFLLWALLPSEWPLCFPGHLAGCLACAWLHGTRFVTDEQKRHGFPLALYGGTFGLHLEVRALACK